MKVKTIFAILAASAAVLFLTFTVIMGIGAYQYVEATPEITVNGPVHAAAGSTLHISELAEIELEKVRSMQMIAPWNEPMLNHACVSSDQQYLYVGDSAGTFDVTISVSGETAERREATVTVIVTDPE